MELLTGRNHPNSSHALTNTPARRIPKPIKSRVQVDADGGKTLSVLKKTRRMRGRKKRRPKAITLQTLCSINPPDSYPDLADTQDLLTIPQLILTPGDTPTKTYLTNEAVLRQWPDPRQVSELTSMKYSSPERLFNEVVNFIANTYEYRDKWNPASCSIDHFKTTIEAMEQCMMALVARLKHIGTIAERITCETKANVAHHKNLPHWFEGHNETTLAQCLYVLAEDQLENLKKINEMSMFLQSLSTTFHHIATSSNEASFTSDINTTELTSGII